VLVLRQQFKMAAFPSKSENLHHVGCTSFRLNVPHFFYPTQAMSPDSRRSLVTSILDDLASNLIHVGTSFGHLIHIEKSVIKK
jgi:hypothetical protein